MAAAAPVLARLTPPQPTRDEREQQMREFFGRMEQSERERWILLIEMRVMQAK